MLEVEQVSHWNDRKLFQLCVTKITEKLKFKKNPDKHCLNMFAFMCGVSQSLIIIETT